MTLLDFMQLADDGCPHCPEHLYPVAVYQMSAFRWVSGDIAYAAVLNGYEPGAT